MPSEITCHIEVAKELLPKNKKNNNNKNKEKNKEKRLLSIVWFLYFIHFPETKSAQQRYC